MPPCWYATCRLLLQVVPAAGVSVSNVDLTDLEAVRRAMIPGKTKMLMVESPTNPRMQVRRQPTQRSGMPPAAMALHCDSTCSAVCSTRAASSLHVNNFVQQPAMSETFLCMYGHALCPHQLPSASMPLTPTPSPPPRHTLNLTRHPPSPLQVCDIKALAEIAHAAGALCLVDNSFMSPIFQRPLELGADISMISGTKFIGGHSDVTCGVLSVSAGLLAHTATLPVGGGIHLAGWP